MKLQDKIYLLRKHNNMSQMELAEALNVSRQTISKWELGISIPTIDNLISLSKVFNVSVDFLTDEEVDIDSKTPEKKVTAAYYKLNYKLMATRVVIISSVIIIAIIIGYTTHTIVTVFLALLTVGFIFLTFVVIKLIVRMLVYFQQKNRK